MQAGDGRRPASTAGPGTPAVVLATAGGVLAIAPIVLVGAQAVQIGATLGMSPGTLGVTASVFFGTTALSTASLGRLVQRYGPRRSLTWAALLHIAAVLDISATRSILQLASGLVLAGLANGAMQPSANSLLASRGSARRLGFGLGAKQSAPTMASLLAGFAVPGVALTVGWRWSFVSFAVIGLLFIWMVRRFQADAAAPAARAAPVKMPGIRGPSLPVPWLAVVAGLGACAGNSLNLFAVDYGVHVAGLAPGAAGEYYALAGLAGLLGRLLGGRWMDRPSSPGPLPVTLGLIVVAAASDLVMSLGGPVPFVAGMVAAYGLGWAWPALLHYAAVSYNMPTAATATGTLMTGFAAGSLTGPLFLGQVASLIGYRHVWLVASGFNVLAALLLGSRMLYGYRDSVSSVHSIRRGGI